MYSSSSSLTDGINFFVVVSVRGGSTAPRSGTHRRMGSSSVCTRRWGTNALASRCARRSPRLSRNSSRTWIAGWSTIIPSAPSVLLQRGQVTDRHPERLSEGPCAGGIGGEIPNTDGQPGKASVHIMKRKLPRLVQAQQDCRQHESSLGQVADSPGPSERD